MNQPRSSPLGTLATVAKLTLKAALNTVRDNRALVEHLSQRLYEGETSRADWAKLGASERAVWSQRVHLVLSGLAGSIGL